MIRIRDTAREVARSRPRRFVFECLAVAFLAGHAQGQSLLEQDIQLGLTFHHAVVERARLVEGPEAARLRAIFSRILETSHVRGGPALPHRLFMIASPEPNAFATGGGRVYVTDGLWRVLAGQDGMLAFVIAHEVAHNLRLHGIVRLLRLRQYQATLRVFADQAAAGSKAAGWALLGWGVGGKVLDDKLSRVEEHEADMLGTALAAEAGYHPDYAILAARRLRRELGDMHRFAAFFAQHPRWKTREERAVENYERLVEIFSSRWPAVSDSPGRRPPFLVIHGKLSVERDKSKRVYLLSTWYRARNVDEPVQILAGLLGEKRQVPPRIVWQTTARYDSPESEPVHVEVPEDELKEYKGKLWWSLCWKNGSQIECSDRAKVR